MPLALPRPRPSPAGPKGVNFDQFWSQEMGCRLWPGNVLSTSLELNVKAFWAEKEVVGVSIGCGRDGVFWTEIDYTNVPFSVFGSL